MGSLRFCRIQELQERARAHFARAWLWACAPATPSRVCWWTTQLCDVLGGVLQMSLMITSDRTTTANRQSEYQLILTLTRLKATHASDGCLHAQLRTRHTHNQIDLLVHRVFVYT
jgi:hypothetical protein